MGDDWTRVERRRRPVKDRLGPLPSSKFDHIRAITNTVFVANFPPHLTYNELWKICATYGPILDLFIAKKRTKKGEMFAFARFEKSVPPEPIASKLSNRWIGQRRLWANVERYHRPTTGIDKAPRKHVDIQQTPAPVRATTPTVDLHTPVMRKSYAESVSSPSPAQDDRQDEVILLSDQAAGSQICSVVGRVKEFQSMINIRQICSGEGFHELDFYFLGGFWMMFNFHSKDVCDKFLAHSGVMSWFTELRSWDSQFRVMERLAWLDVEGIPFLAWNRTSMERIVQKWGTIFYVEDAEKHNRLSIKIGILTLDQSFIRGVIPVLVDDTKSVVRVRELSGWTPELADNTEDADSGCGDSVDPFDGNNMGGENSMEDEELDFQNDKHCSDDPFQLNELIHKSGRQKEVVQKEAVPNPPDHPPGFTPPCSEDKGERIDKQREGIGAVADSEGSRGLKGSFSSSSIRKNSGSILEELNHTIEVGESLGFNMKGVEANMQAIIEDMGGMNFIP